VNILFYHHNRFLPGELQEFFGEMGGQPHFADVVESAIEILNTRPIDVAFIEIQDFTDIGLLKYINQYFQSMRTVLVVENEFEKAISAVKNGKYGILRQPFGLSEIESFVTKII